jgi:hypothetical protein
MTWTRYIPFYGRLIAEVQRQAGLRQAADEEIRYLRATCDHLRDELDESRKDGLHSRELVADWLAQRTFGFGIYAQGIPLPAQSPEPVTVPRKMNGRQMVQQAEREFAQALYGEEPQNDTRTDTPAA